MNEKKIAFDVYLLDVYLDEGGWIENERHLLGNLEVEPAIGKEIGQADQRLGHDGQANCLCGGLLRRW